MATQGKVTAGLSTESLNLNRNTSRIKPIKELSLDDKTLSKDELKLEFKEALKDAHDIIEGKRPRKSLKDILNG